MRKLLIIGLSTVVLGSCTTPMERAENTCRQIGNPSPACVERQFNFELSRADAFHQQRMNILNSEYPQYPSQQPKESEYDRRVRAYGEEFKNNCERTGGVYEEYGNGQSCGAPKPKVSVSPQPSRPPSQQPSPPPDNTEKGKQPIDNGANTFPCPSEGYCGPSEGQ